VYAPLPLPSQQHSITALWRNQMILFGDREIGMKIWPTVLAHPRQLATNGLQVRRALLRALCHPISWNYTMLNMIQPQCLRTAALELEPSFEFDCIPSLQSTIAVSESWRNAHCKTECYSQRILE